MRQVQELAEQYVGVWNLKDPEERRRTIAELWAPEGRHYASTLEAVGHAALEQRVTGSHERNVRDRGFVFRPVGKPKALRDVVTFDWEMLPAAGGEIAATGSIFAVLDAQGKIVTDYQFFD